jgi:hypothetical protein
MMALMQEWQLVVYPFETKPAITIAEAVPNRDETVVENEANNRTSGGGTKEH